MNKDEVKKILKDVGLSPAETAVYVALLDGFYSVKEILRITGEKRPTVYYSLGSLEKRGLVSKTGKDYGNKYQLEPVQKIVELIDKNIRKQNALMERAKKLERFYPNDKKKGKVIVSYFDDLASIHSAISHSLYGKEKNVRSIVPSNNFFHEIGKDFVEEFVIEKKKRGIKTMALWEDIPSQKVMSEYYVNSVIKQLPIDMHNRFETTIFLYDDKTLYISPKKENFAVLIQSEAHSKLMKTIFEHIWSNAILLKSAPNIQKNPL